MRVSREQMHDATSAKRKCERERSSRVRRVHTQTHLVIQARLVLEVGHNVVKARVVLTQSEHACPAEIVEHGYTRHTQRTCVCVYVRESVRKRSRGSSGNN